MALAVTARTVASDLPLAVGVSFGLAKVAEVLIASYLMKGPGKFKGELDSVRAVLSLVLGAAVAGSIVGALTSTIALCSLGLAPWSRFFELSSIWWLGDAMGILIAVPAILFVSRQKTLVARPERDVLRGNDCTPAPGHRRDSLRFFVSGTGPPSRLSLLSLHFLGVFAF